MRPGKCHPTCCRTTSVPVCAERSARLLCNAATCASSTAALALGSMVLEADLQCHNQSTHAFRCFLGRYHKW